MAGLLRPAAGAAARSAASRRATGPALVPHRRLAAVAMECWSDWEEEDEEEAARRTRASALAPGLDPASAPSESFGSMPASKSHHRGVPHCPSPVAAGDY